jgi:hypothetical protein
MRGGNRFVGAPDAAMVTVVSNPPSPIVHDVTGEALQFHGPTDPVKNRAMYRTGEAVTLNATPVGPIGVKSVRQFTRNAVFVMDDEPKLVPPPNITIPVRESLFQPYQRHHYQFGLNTDYGRVPNGQYPRAGTVLMAFARTGGSPMKQVGNIPQWSPGQRPAPRFTKVNKVGRPDTAPQYYERRFQP